MHESWAQNNKSLKENEFRVPAHFSCEVHSSIKRNFLLPRCPPIPRARTHYRRKQRGKRLGKREAASAEDQVLIQILSRSDCISTFATIFLFLSRTSTLECVWEMCVGWEWVLLCATECFYFALIILALLTFSPSSSPLQRNQ